VEKKGPVSTIETEINNFLEQNGYELLDYIKGIAKFRDSKNTTTIGKILTKLKADTLMKKFISDESRKSLTSNVEELMVVISRHPYDIAGSDTDRNWENCMTIGTGLNHHYLINDVKEGSLISYLINKNDKNINNPLAVLNIKPYVNNEDSNDFILLSDSKTYGRGRPEFKETVDAVLSKINKEKEGFYCLKDGLYRDDLGDGVKIIGKQVQNQIYNTIKNELNECEIIKGETKIIISDGEKNNLDGWFIFTKNNTPLVLINFDLSHVYLNEPFLGLVIGKYSDKIKSKISEIFIKSFKEYIMDKYNKKISSFDLVTMSYNSDGNINFKS
jgi:hypothetical protein